MKDTSRVLDVLSADMLRMVVDILEVDCADRRKTAALKSAIVESGASARQILDTLNVADLRAVAAALGMRTSGKRAELIDRLALSPETDAIDVPPEKSSETPSPDFPPTDSDSKHLSAQEEFERTAFRVWLQGEFLANRVRKGGISHSFCPACSKRHPQQWVGFENSERSFYLCFVGDPMVVDSAHKGSKFSVSAPTEFVKRNTIDPSFRMEVERFQNSAATQANDADARVRIAKVEEKLVELASPTTKKSFWDRFSIFTLTAGKGMVQYTKVEVTPLPPFVSLTIEMGDVTNAFKDGWKAAS